MKRKPPEIPQRDLTAAQELGLLSILGAFCLLVCLMTWTGCKPHKDLKREAFSLRMKPSHGKCLAWDIIELELKGHSMCSERRVINGYHVFCTRKLGHRNACHMHGGEGDCYWMW